MSDAEINLIGDVGEAVAFMDWLQRDAEPLLAIDTETTGTDYRDRIRTVQVGDTKTAWVIPYERGGWGGLARHLVDHIISHERKVVMHNFKFDQAMLEADRLSIPDRLVYDTRIMAHLLDPTRPTGLKPLADRYVRGSASSGQTRLHDKMKKNRWTWATVPVDDPDFWFYGGLDTVITARLFHELEPMVFPKFQSIYDLEHQAQVVLRGVESRGCRLDLDYCSRMVSELADEVQALRALAASGFGVKNLTSSDQVAAALMADGWVPEQFTDSGKPSMRKEVLAGLVQRWPLAALAMECKHLEKMASTQYLGGYAALVDDDGLLHPNINPIGARTGRMSVRTPALQTLHRDALVRDAFVPREGNRLVFVDYDQMEVRLTAAFSGDRDYIDLIMNSKDVHRTTAAEVYGISEDAVTKSMRQRTKNVIYAKLYGAGIPKFSATAGISIEEGRQFMQAFDYRFPAVAGFISYIVGESNMRGHRTKQGVAEQRYYDEGLAYVMSPYGRRHILNEREVRPWSTGEGEQYLSGPVYRLVNYLVQGTGADVIKHAIVNAERAGISDYLVQVVHDETGWDIPTNEVEEVEREIKKAMTMDDFMGSGIDLTCESSGPVSRWGDKYADTRGRSATVDLEIIQQQIADRDMMLEMVEYE